jgi:hypothetical protein
MQPVFGAAIAAILLTPLAAASIDADGFPHIADAPAWYATAPAPPHVTDFSGVYIRSDESDEWGERATWYLPGGAEPDRQSDGARSPDISIETSSYVPFNGEAERADPELLIIATNDAFPQMVADLGTTLTIGIAIPDPMSLAAVPKLRFIGHGLIVIQRPPILCTGSSDPADFVIPAAMLGENGSRYLVELEVSFGDRRDELRRICDDNEEPKPESTPMEATPAAINTPSTEPTPLPTEAAVGETDPGDGVHPLAVGGIAAVAVALTMWLVLRRKRPQFRNDGTPVDSESAAARAASRRGYGR